MKNNHHCKSNFYLKIFLPKPNKNSFPSCFAYLFHFSHCEQLHPVIRRNESMTIIITNTHLSLRLTIPSLRASTRHCERQRSNLLCSEAPLQIPTCHCERLPVIANEVKQSLFVFPTFLCLPSFPLQDCFGLMPSQ